jgi:hypothetical protein
MYSERSFLGPLQYSQITLQQCVLHHTWDMIKVQPHPIQLRPPNGKETRRKQFRHLLDSENPRPNTFQDMHILNVYNLKLDMTIVLQLIIES